MKCQSVSIRLHIFMVHTDTHAHARQQKTYICGMFDGQWFMAQIKKNNNTEPFIGIVRIIYSVFCIHEINFHFLKCRLCTSCVRVKSVQSNYRWYGEFVIVTSLLVCLYLTSEWKKVHSTEEEEKLQNKIARSRDVATKLHKEHWEKINTYRISISIIIY